VAYRFGMKFHAESIGSTCLKNLEKWSYDLFLIGSRYVAYSITSIGTEINYIHGAQIKNSELSRLVWDEICFRVPTINKKCVCSRRGSKGGGQGEHVSPNLREKKR